MSSDPIENTMRAFRMIEWICKLCLFFLFIFTFMFCVGVGFYFGATVGGWMPEQEIHTENTNLFPSECVITEVSSAGVKQ